MDRVRHDSSRFSSCSLWALVLGDLIIQNSTNFFTTLNQNRYQSKNGTLTLNNSITDKQNQLKEGKNFLESNFKILHSLN